MAFLQKFTDSLKLCLFPYKGENKTKFTLNQEIGGEYLTTFTLNQETGCEYLTTFTLEEQFEVRNDHFGSS